MDYFEKMYFLLFNAVTDALRELDQGHQEMAQSLLKHAQQDCEEIYMDA